MSRNGGSRIAPSLTMRIRPPRSTTNRRPLPSPALVTSRGAENPVTATVAWTVWPVGSNEPAGLVDGPPDATAALGAVVAAIGMDAVGAPATGLPRAGGAEDDTVVPQPAMTI